MLQKKFRNKTARKLSHRMTFIIRHKLAHKLCATFDYLNGLNKFPTSQLRFAEIPFIRKDDDHIVIYGYEFETFIDKYFDDLDTYQYQKEEYVDLTK